MSEKRSENLDNYAREKYIEEQLGILRNFGMSYSKIPDDYKKKIDDENTSIICLSNIFRTLKKLALA